MKSPAYRELYDSDELSNWLAAIGLFIENVVPKVELLIMEKPAILVPIVFCQATHVG